MTGDPLRALFFNEGELGNAVLGIAQSEAAVRVGLRGTPVSTRFVRLTPMGPLALRTVSLLPVLGRRDLDLQTSRWHLVQALRARRQIQAELAREPADVVMVTSHSITLAMGGLARRTPLAVSVDTTVWPWRAMAIWQPLYAHSRAAVALSLVAERRALSRAAIVLARTRWAERGVLASAPAARVIVHHPGLDLERFRPPEAGRRDGPVRVLFVGGRFERKGGHDLLAALGDRLGRDVELDIVTRDLVTERPGVRVHRGLTPGDDALVALHQDADVFCLPTYGDAVPWAILEAMACGTAVVSTPIGGIAEQLDDGSAGVLVAPGDRDGLRRALDGLIDDEGRRRELAEAARARCRERYDARVQGRELADLLAAAVRRHRAAA